MSDRHIITIDGPAGAGKSTVARRVAERLGIGRVDTGAVYRAVSLLALERDLDDDSIADRSREIVLEFALGRVLLEGRDVTDEIRTPRVTEKASRVSAIPAVRTALLELQRRLGRADPKGAVVDGRDAGTVIFPDAGTKVFLTASTEERARRRTRELEETEDLVVYDEVLRDIVERDRRDTTRTVAPLVPARDAVVVDSTDRSIDEVVEEIARIASARRAE